MLKKLLIIVMFVMTSNYVSANSDIFYQNQAPIMCTTPVQMDQFLNDMGMKPHSLGFGRSGGNIDGDIVFALSHWKNEEGTMMAVIETPANAEKCMVYMIFNYNEVIQEN